MNVKPIQNKQEWEDFVKEQEPTSLLQSWLWKEFLSLDKKSPLAFFIVENGEVLAAALLSRVELTLGRHYFYVPRGPIFKSGLSANVKEKVLAALAQFFMRDKSGAIFLRVDPAQSPGEINFYKAGFRKANREVQPRHTRILNLEPLEEELILQMKPKTRYNIRVAEKKGLRIITAHTDNDISEFYDILTATGERGGFHIHTVRHYLNLWRALNPDNLRVYFAETPVGKKIAAIMVTYYADTAVYLHGGSLHDFRSTMAPYLLHWQAIKDAKHNGLRLYDFWGVAPAISDQSHRWQGITRFKEGFGGQYKEYVGAHDYVFSEAWYRIFNTARGIVKKVRG